MNFPPQLFSLYISNGINCIPMRTVRKGIASNGFQPCLELALHSSSYNAVIYQHEVTRKRELCRLLYLIKAANNWDCQSVLFGFGTFSVTTYYVCLKKSVWVIDVDVQTSTVKKKCG